MVAAAIAAAVAARGERVAAHKPVMTGLEDPTDPAWPPDHELLASVTGQSPTEVAPIRFGPSVSPHLAAELEGGALEPSTLVRGARGSAAYAELVVVEGVGGLLVPFTDRYCVADLAADLGLPLVVAARPGLGTINHTLLTLESARARGLKVAGVVLTPWPEAPGVVERSNRDSIGRLAAVQVATLPRLDAGRPDALARAGAALPLADWLA